MSEPPERLNAQSDLDGITAQLRAPHSAAVDVGALIGATISMYGLQFGALIGAEWPVAGVAVAAPFLMILVAAALHVASRLMRLSKIDLRITDRTFAWRRRIGPVPLAWRELPLHAVEPYVEGYHLWVRDTRDGAVHKIGEQTADVLRWLDHRLDIEAAHAPLPIQEADVPAAVQRMRGKMPEG